MWKYRIGAFGLVILAALVGFFAANEDLVVPPALQHRMVGMYKNTASQIELFGMPDGHTSIFWQEQSEDHHRIIDFLHPAVA